MVITITSIFFGKEPDSKYSSVSSIEIATVILISFESKCCFIFVLFLFFIVIFFLFMKLFKFSYFFAEENEAMKKQERSPVPFNVKGNEISLLFDITLHFFSTVSALIRNEVNHLYACIEYCFNIFEMT